jgi:hypothetical protein
MAAGVGEFSPPCSFRGDGERLAENPTPPQPHPVSVCLSFLRPSLPPCFLPSSPSPFSLCPPMGRALAGGHCPACPPFLSRAFPGPFPPAPFPFPSPFPPSFPAIVRAYAFPGTNWQRLLPPIRPAFPRDPRPRDPVAPLLPVSRLCPARFPAFPGLSQPSPAILRPAPARSLPGALFCSRPDTKKPPR